ncbi:MAG: GNAT family N-acetyltransferase [Acidimicrobiia bacterium]
MDITLRPVTEAELVAFKRATAVAFGNVQSDEEAQSWGAGVELDRTLAAFDGETIIGTAAALSFELTVPGGALVPTAGVTMVGVHPTHRRRGLLVRMMEEQLADVAARGEPLAVLTASESAIYRRFGYGLATFSTFWTLRTEGTDFASPPTVDGRFRLIEPAEAATAVPPLYDAARRRHVGEVTRHPAWFEQIFSEPAGGKGPRRVFTAVHESVAGDADGFARYRIKDDWSGGIAANTLEVIDLYALDDEVEAALWQFLIDIDLVANVKAFGRPVDDPIRWRLADPRRMQITEVTDHLWLRVVDPAVALAARTYGSRDRVVVELTDPFLPGNEGRWSIDNASDDVTVQRTDDDADLAMSASELGGLYLGGVSATTLARAGRIAELVPGAIARADTFFTTTPAPWCRTDF